MKPMLRPSQLLQHALNLFGPKGNNWIKDEEHIIGFFCFRGRKMETANDVFAKLTHELIRAVKRGKGIVAAARELEDQYVYDPRRDTYCSIGAVRKVNTPNEVKATQYLARAIKPDVDINDSVAVVAAIVNANDNRRTAFKDVQRWFKTAIKRAKLAGE